jgi:hypothetical protein
MGGRFSTLLADFIRRLFATEGGLPNLRPLRNRAPSQDALVVRRPMKIAAVTRLVVGMKRSCP